MDRAKMFMDKVKDKIKVASPGPKRDVLRVVLGTLQNMEVPLAEKDGKPVVHIFNEETCLDCVAGIRKSNLEVLRILRERGDLQDERIAKLEEENVALEELLPKYLTKEEIRNELVNSNIDLKSPPKDGPAVGMAMKYLTSKKLEVDGHLVKEVVTEIRCTG